MKARIFNLWDSMSGSYWFVPALIIISAGMAAILLPLTDQHFAEVIGVVIPQHAISPSSAQLILSTIIGAMTTVISLVFSLTILTLSIATSQFGPRLLRSFLNNRSTQIALGTFVATAVYALILLTLLRDTDNAFVPRLSLLVAIFVAVVNLIYLIHFVSDISELIQVPNVVAQVARDLDDSIERLYPPQDEAAQSTADDRDAFEGDEGTALTARKEGYLQGVDREALVAMAREADIVLHLIVRPGHFIALGKPLAQVQGTPPDDASLDVRLNQCIVTGPRRTPRQDVECALLELVELAVRALSPGINDPFTAVNCTDRLGAALGRIANRNVPSARFKDEDDVVRLVTPETKLENLLDAAFNQIRQHGRGNTAVLIRILEALGEVARQTQRRDDANAIVRHIAMIEREAEESIHEPNDRDDLKKSSERITRLLKPWADRETSSRTEPA